MKISGNLAVKVTPDVLVPKRGAAPAAFKFGIGELLFLSFHPPLVGAAAQGRWQGKLGVGQLIPRPGCPSEAQYFCPSTPQYVSLHYQVPRAPDAPPGPTMWAGVEFNVIVPKFNMVNYQNRLDPIPHPNAGFSAAFILTPDDVSFARVALRECGGDNKWAALTDNPPSIDASMHLLGKKHTSDYPEKWSFDFNKINRPAGSCAQYIPQTAMSIGKVCPNCQIIRAVRDLSSGKDVSGTVMFIDKIYNSLNVNPTPWVARGVAGGTDVLAEYYLDIPVHYTVLNQDGQDPGTAQIGTRLTVNRHSFKVLRDGTLTVNKGGCSNTTQMNQILSTTALTSSANPSTVNQSVTFVATVAHSNGAAPTGNVTFQADATPLGAGPVNLVGESASFSTAGLTRGKKTITATYNAPAGVIGSSASLSQEVK